MTRQDQIDHIVANFDFEKVRDVMTHLDWTWAMGAEPRVPTILELKEMARRHLENVEENGWMQAGGFCVRDMGGVLRVSFEVEWLMAKYEI